MRFASKLISNLSILCLLLVASSSLTFATTCEPRTPEQHIQDSDIVFFGEIINDRRKRKATYEYTTQDFEVIRVYKGDIADIVTIKYYNDFGGNHGWGFRRRQPTLIFANSPRKNVDGKQLYLVHFCSMAPFHLNYRDRPTYWDLLSSMPKSE